MKMITKYIIAAAGLLLASGVAFAGQADTTEFNALDYSMQKRYRPQDEPFARHAFFCLQAGTEQYIRRSHSSFGWGPVAREQIGMRVSKYSSVAVGISAGTLRRNYDARRAYRGGAEIMHYFDLTSFIGGYREDRALSLYTVRSVPVAALSFPLTSEATGISTLNHMQMSILMALTRAQGSIGAGLTGAMV